jgi:cytochrome c
MKTPALAALLAAALFAPIALAGEGDARRGGELYRACIACHTLEPGLHTSGPSLAGLMGRAAGGAEGFVRYSPSLRGVDFDWDAVALDAWLADPCTTLLARFVRSSGRSGSKTTKPRAP